MATATAAPAMTDDASKAAPTKRKDDTEILPAISVNREPLQVGPYRILGVMGRGGMGTVYRAQVVVSCEIPIGRQVAVKILRHIADKQERQRFAREAGYLQALRHPGIVRVLDAGEHHGQPYLVMQLVEGRLLSDLIVNNASLDEQHAADICLQALEALHVAHLGGILHRDVKPGNMMITPQGTVKLLDFGLAQRMDGASKLTATGTVIGTPAYMSPEQAAGERAELSQRSDVYSAGACLYELVTGQQPYSAENSVALLRRIIEEPLVPPSQLRPGLSADLETIILKAMSKHPADRYQSAELMAEDLRRFRRGKHVATRRPGRWRPVLRAAWGQRRAIASLGLVAFITATILVVAVRKARQLSLERAAEADQRQARLIDSEWVDAWTQPGPLFAPRSPLHAKPYAAFGKGVELVALPNVSGAVRLTLVFEPVKPKWFLEVLVNDRDVGRGYRLRFTGDADGGHLVLLREKKVVASSDLGVLESREQVTLRLEQVDDTVTGEIDGFPPLRFLDLTPIEGRDADGVYLALVPGESEISDIKLERQRSGIYVSALAPADALRQDGRYDRAIREYEAFLADHPESPLVRDARFRIALCLEAQGDDEQALAAFLEVVRRYRQNPRYVLVATFRAWGCALRLGRYQEAEQYLEVIRRDFDLPTLLASVAQETVQNLVRDYMARAESLAISEPERAVRLYTTGADLAGYLGLTAMVATGHSNAGDILLSTDHIDEAIEHYQAIVNNLQMPAPLRTRALLKTAEAQRLSDRFDAAQASYQAVIDNPTAVDDQSQNARLWLGDLYLQLGQQAKALALWQSSKESESPAGKIMRHLLIGERPMPLSEDRNLANDIEYFNARLALKMNLNQQYGERLTNVVRLGPAHDWPTPLARHLLRALATAKPAD